MSSFLSQLTTQVFHHADQLIAFGIVFILLEMLLPVKDKASMPSKEMAIDAINSFILVISVPFFLIIPISIGHWLLSTLSGQLYSPLLGGVGFWWQLLIAVVVIDFVGYWRHRLMHCRLLWPIHAIHHSSKTLNWLSLDRFHILNHMITVSLNTIVMVICFEPLIALTTMYMRRIYGQFIHANVKIHYGPLDHLFVSPLFHHWHHSNLPEAHDKNYTVFLSVFDKLFGSFYLPKDKHFPVETGIDENLPSNLWLHFLHPFKKWHTALQQQNTGG